MIEVVNKLKVYEVAGRDVSNDPDRELCRPTTTPILRVLSHWIHQDRVVLQPPTGDPITVVAADLIAAIRNATHNSFP